MRTVIQLSEVLWEGKSVGFGISKDGSGYGGFKYKMNGLSSQSGVGYEFYSLLHHVKLNEIKKLVLLSHLAGGTIQFVQELLSEAITSKEALDSETLAV